MKFTTVNTGMLTASNGFMLEFGEGMVDCPTPVSIIEHPKHGVILFDTGLNGAISDTEEANRHYFPGVRDAFGAMNVTREQAIDRQLAALGYAASDVSHVIYSHLHLDHAGGMAYFPNACHVVQRDEIRYAFWPDRWIRTVYCQSDFSCARGFDILEVDGNVDLFEDGTLQLIKTPGHAPGHQMLLLDLPHRGRVCLAADVCHTLEAFGKAAPMPFDHDASANDQSHMVVKRLMTAGIPVFFAHEMTHFDALPKDGIHWD